MRRVASLFLFCPAFLIAGELEPTGPPAPTSPSLADLSDGIDAAVSAAAAGVDPRIAIESLPFVITQSGSYYLISDLTGEAGQVGIEVRSEDVTIDLNGFTLRGVPGSLDGIQLSPFGFSTRNVTVKNGVIRDWDGTAIGEDFEINGYVVENILMFNNRRGLDVFGENGSVVTSHAVSHEGVGFWVNNSTVRDCTARDNGNGIRLNRSTAFNCNATENRFGGFTSDFGSTLINCHAFDNGQDGIGGLTTLNIVENCTVGGSTLNGIAMGDGSIVRGCTVSGNAANGIVVSRGARVESNHCRANGLAGIEANREENHIEGNTVSDNSFGIRVDHNLAQRNVITRNTATGNVSAEYMVDAGDNTLAPVRTSFITAGPWDNFDF